MAASISMSAFRARDVPRFSHTPCPQGRPSVKYLGHSARPRWTESLNECPLLSQHLLVEHVVVDTGVLPTDLVRAVARVVREGLDEPQFRVELAQVVALEIDVQVCVDPDEALRLVPALNVRVVARPRLEPLEPPRMGTPFCLLEQRRRDPQPLRIGVDGEVPDHPTDTRPVRECG